MSKYQPLSELVRKYGKSLPDVLKDAVQPIYNFDMENVFDPGEIEYLEQLGSEMPLNIFTERGPAIWNGPLPGQQHVIAAIVKAWQEDVRNIIIRGEAGVGKTQISVMAMEMALRDGMDVFPAIVIEPRRVTRQWRNRVKQILPDVMTLKIEKPADVELFAALARIYRDRKKLMGFIPNSMISRSSGMRAVGRMVSYRRTKGVDDRYEPISPFLLGQTGYMAVGCPTCFYPQVEIPAKGWSRMKTESLFTMADLEKVLNRGQRPFCDKCGGALFEEVAAIPVGKTAADRHLRFDVGEYLYRNRKRLHRLARGPVYRTLVIDEMHKMANDSSIRGGTVAMLANYAEYVMGLSATIYGGTASSLMWLYFMFYPEEWHNWGGSLSQARLRWIDELANTAVITKTKRINVGTPHETRTKKELPSAPPKLVKMLAPKTIHVKIEDLGILMPPYEILGIPVELDPDHKREYDAFFKQTLAKAQSYKGGMFASAHLQSSLTYAIAPTVDFHSDNDANVKLFPESYVCAPERALIEFVTAELENDRKTIIYVTHTDVRDIVPRIMWALDQNNVSSIRLPKSINREDIPDWLQDEAPKFDTVILNQKAVEGVDAVKFQNTFFYEVDYSVYPVEQASRRHWRLNQVRPCKTVFLEVRGTMLFRALAMVMQKMAAASVLYGDDIEAQIGKFSAHSLLTQAIKDELEDTELPDIGDLYQKAAENITKGTTNDNGSDVHDQEPEGTPGPSTGG